MSSVSKAKILLFIRFVGESLFFPYISLFLPFSDSVKGIIIGLIPLTALVCAPIYSKVFNTPKKAKCALMVMSAVEAALVLLFMFFGYNLTAAITLIVLISAVSSSNYGLLDSLLGLICTQSGKTYGKARIFGGIAYLFGSFAVWLITQITKTDVNYRLIFSITVGLYVAVSVLFVFVKAPVPEGETSAKGASVKSVLCDKRFMGYVLFYVLLIGSMQVCDDFYSMYLVSKGNPDSLYSLVMFGFVGVEILIMLILNRFAKPDLKFMFVACGVLIARLIVQSVPSLPTWALIAAQLSRGITWGMALFVSTQYIIKILGFERSTTGIVLCAFFVSVYNCVFKLCGGYIISAIDYPYFYMIFAVIAFVDIIYLAAYSRATKTKLLKKEKTMKLFGKLGKKGIYAYTLENDFLKVTLLNYGATIQSIKVKTPQGLRDVALGYDDLQSYIDKSNYFGATVGRVANRVSNARFKLNGKEYVLEKNDKNNCLHGGFHGFDSGIFDAEEKDGGVVFSLTSADGDGGFPAELKLKVNYRLEGGALCINYTAVSDGDTVWNPTNHTFFNLCGKPEKVYGTLLKIYADKFTPVNGNLIPTGELKPVAGTVFDFTSFKEIGKEINSDDEQLKLVGGGYDHNFVLNGNRAAIAECGGVKLDVFTDMPGVQLYTANFLDGANCFNGVYGKHYAFCLEPQYFPDAVNIDGFEKPFLKAGEPGNHYIRFEFSVI